MENLDNPHSCLALTVSFSFLLSVLNADSPELILATWRNVDYKRQAVSYLGLSVDLTVPGLFI